MGAACGGGSGRGGLSVGELLLRPPSFEVRSLGVADMDFFDLTGSLEEAAEFIEEGRKAGGGVVCGVARRPRIGLP